MYFETIINVLNERFGIEGIRYLKIWEPPNHAYLRRLRKQSGEDYFSCVVVFQLCKKIYRVRWDFHEPNFECKEKREWAQKDKKAEWIDNEFTRDLSSLLCNLRFNEDGDQIV